MVLQPLRVTRPAPVLGEARLQPARRLAKPGGDLLEGLVVGCAFGDHGSP